MAFINGSEWEERRKYLQRTFGTITSSAFIHKKILKLFENYLYTHLDKEIIVGTGKGSDGRWMCSKYMNKIAMYTVMMLVFDCEGDLDDINNAFYKSFIASSKRLVPAVSLYLVYASLINFKMPEFVIWNVLSAKRLHSAQIKILRDCLIKNKILTLAGEWNMAHKNQSIMVKDLIQSTEFSANQLLSDCHGLIAAGTETTAKQIEFGLLLLCKYPSLQSLIYNELSESVCACGYDPKMLPNLHYFRAFVHEMIRFGIVTPFGLPHMCLAEDVEIEGFKIYKGQTVIFNYLAMHHHDGLDGHTFDVKRWLDEQKRFRKIDNFMPFGYGRRICVGQQIAMQEIYSVLALILIKYQVFNDEVKDGRTQIKREWSITRDIQPEIPVYLRHRKIV